MITPNDSNISHSIQEEEYNNLTLFSEEKNLLYAMERNCVLFDDINDGQYTPNENISKKLIADFVVITKYAKKNLKSKKSLKEKIVNNFGRNRINLEISEILNSRDALNNSKQAMSDIRHKIYEYRIGHTLDKNNLLSFLTKNSNTCKHKRYHDMIESLTDHVFSKMLLVANSSIIIYFFSCPPKRDSIYKKYLLEFEMDHALDHSAVVIKLEKNKEKDFAIKCIEKVYRLLAGSIYQITAAINYESNKEIVLLTKPYGDRQFLYQHTKHMVVACKSATSLFEYLFNKEFRKITIKYRNRNKGYTIDQVKTLDNEIINATAKEDINNWIKNVNDNTFQFKANAISEMALYDKQMKYYEDSGIDINASTNESVCSSAPVKLQSRSASSSYVHTGFIFKKMMGRSTSLASK